jgi:hypothetical protein
MLAARKSKAGQERHNWNERSEWMCGILLAPPDQALRWVNRPELESWKVFHIAQFGPLPQC